MPALRDTPRPGHADFVAMKKFGGFEDYRGGGHFSGRLTLGLVAAGVIAKKLIAPCEDVRPAILEVGGRKDIEEAIDDAVEKQDSWAGSLNARHRICRSDWVNRFSIP